MSSVGVRMLPSPIGIFESSRAVADSRKRAAGPIAMDLFTDAVCAIVVGVS